MIKIIVMEIMISDTAIRKNAVSCINIYFPSETINMKVAYSQHQTDN